MNEADARLFISKLQSPVENIYIRQGTRFINPENMQIGNMCFFGHDCRIEAIIENNGTIYNPKLQIGDNVTFEDNCHIACALSVVIGSGTMVASRVYISDHSHGSVGSEDFSMRPAMRPLSMKPVCIGKNVWIGENVSILPGVTLGDNVIVGANAVVTHSFGEGKVIAGCPAKIIKALL